MGCCFLPMISEKIITPSMILILGSITNALVLGCQEGSKTEQFEDPNTNKVVIKNDRDSGESTVEHTPGNLDQEDAKAIPPTQVAGAFLVAQCEQLDPNRTSLPSSVKKDDGIFGCHLRRDNNEIVDEPIDGSQFEVLPMDSKKALKGRSLKFESRQWKNIYIVEGLGNQKAQYFYLKGNLSGVPVSFYQPLGSPERDLSCFEQDLKTKMLASTMDYRSSQDPLALGQAPVRIFEGVNWENGDILHLENTSGQSITRTVEQNLGLIPKFTFECPIGWVLTMTNEKGSIVGEFDLDKYHSIPIKNSNISLWIGFRDKMIAGYTQNEGGSLAMGVPHSTEGCKFKFVRELRSCLSR